MKKLITTLLFGVIPQLTFAAALQEFNIDNFCNAVEGGDLAMVQEMLEYTGANVNAEDRLGRTPLMIAAIQGNSDAVKALLVAGANVNAVNSLDQTPLMEAAITGNNDAVEALLAAGANVNARDHHGRTPLMYTAYHIGNNDAVKALLAAGANVNARDSHGRTPLMHAAESGDSDAVEALLTAGAQGRNEAAQAARDRGRNEIAELIEKWIIPIKSASKGAVESQEITPQAVALDEQQQDFSALEKMLNASDKEYDANAAFAIARKYLPFPGLEIEGISSTAQKRLQRLKLRASRASRGHRD